MPFGVKAEINHLPRLRGGVAAHVMAKQIMSEEEIAGATGDLFGRSHRIGRMRYPEYRFRSVLTQIGTRDVVRAGPDPEISHIVIGLIREEDAGEHRE